MILLIIYNIGAIIALILGLILLFKEKDKYYLQVGIIAPMTLLSWITVVLLIWKYRNKFLA